MEGERPSERGRRSDVKKDRGVSWWWEAEKGNGREGEDELEIELVETQFEVAGVA